MNYEEPWVAFKKSERLFHVLLLSYIPGMVVVLLLMTHFAVLARDWVFLLVGLAWLAAFGIAGARCLLFRCPRCVHPFFIKRAWGWARFYNPLARRCLNCGLWKWALTPEGGRYAPAKKR